MPAIRHLFSQGLYISFVALVFSPRIAVAKDAAVPAVRVEKGQIDVAFEAAPQRRGLIASVRVSCQLRNTTSGPDKAQRTFPVAAPADWRHVQMPKTWCQVLVDGKPVEFETKPLVDPADARTRDRPSGELAAVWSQEIDEWIQRDAELLAMVTRFRQLSSRQRELSTLCDAFQDRVKKHLVHAEELQFPVLHIASGNLDFGNLVRLMPEIDPGLRIDEPFQRWKFLSILNESDPEMYRPYEKEWRDKVAKWFASKPELAELLPKLREMWGSCREAQELVSGPITKHVHDVNGLSLPIALQFRSFIQRGSTSPSTALVRTLFPDIGEELDAKAKATTERIACWGFDESTVSLFTGKLNKDGFAKFRGFRDLWRDATVLAELGQPPPSDSSQQHHGSELFAQPVLVTFNAPLDANATATVAILYDTPVQPLIHPFSSAPFRGGLPELTVIFPPPREVQVTVTSPEKFQLVIAPAPESATALENGVRRFQTQLSGDASMLHVVAVGFDSAGNAYVDRFAKSDSRVRTDVETLIEETTNPTVRPLLMSALYKVMLQNREPWKAHQLALKLQQDHADFAGCFKALRGRRYEGREAEELYEWVVKKGKSPRLESKSDFRRFRSQSSNDRFVLSPAALKELVQRVQALDERNLDFHERMGRRFILCHAGIDTKNNLAELLALAEANPKEVVASLKLIQFLKIDKSAALPFVLKQFAPEMRAKLRAKGLLAWQQQHNGAYYALRTFRSPKTAARIIEFLHSTDDSLLIQGAVTALSQMTLPELFDELAGIADRVAGASESAYIQYLGLLIRSDRKKAIPLLDDLRERHPKLARHVMQILGATGRRTELPKAVHIYRWSRDFRGELASAIIVLSDLADPKDIAELRYRRGLPSWMNERLVSVIRFKGGDKSVYPFVEAYYQELVRGQKAHNHLTCVAAFERIGDRRALPHLKEILKTTERKRDASHAIGNLLLDRRIKRDRYVNNPIDEHVQTIARADSTDESRAAAWEALLSDPDASVKRMLQRGPLRSSIENSRLDWSREDRANLALVSRFGDVAARHLLEASDGCSLERRYRIARVLEILLPDSHPVIQAASEDESVDEDRRHTATLALKIHENRSQPTK